MSQITIAGPVLTLVGILGTRTAHLDLSEHGLLVTNCAVLAERCEGGVGGLLATEMFCTGAR